MKRVRWFNSCSRIWSNSSKGLGAVKSENIKLTRQQKIDNVNIESQSQLYYIDKEFGLFNRNVTKVLDLGYVPGNWLEVARYKMCEVLQIDESDLNEQCTLLGFDILFGTPPLGTSSIQGNIFSKTSHRDIVAFFKDMELKRQEKMYKKNKIDDDFDNSYFAKEQIDIESLGHHMQQMDLNEKQLDYKPQLILSDLSTFFKQERGFWNNTNTRPYLRFAANNILNQPITDSSKSCIDMGDATLVLCCDLLRDNGTLVLRLAGVNVHDREYDILRQRCQRVFATVAEWKPREHEVFLVCKGKRPVDKRDVFMYKK